MMSLLKLVVAPPIGVPSKPLVPVESPSLPDDQIRYAWAGVTAPMSASALKRRGLPQPSFTGTSLMYVGPRAPESSTAVIVFEQVVTAEIVPAALYLFISVARASQPVAIVRMSAIVLFCLDRCIAVSRFGIAMAARMPMIATTISSSMRVKPFCFLLIIDPPDGFLKRHGCTKKRHGCTKK